MCAPIRVGRTHRSAPTKTFFISDPTPTPRSDRGGRSFRKSPLPDRSNRSIPDRNLGIIDSTDARRSGTPPDSTPAPTLPARIDRSHVEARRSARAPPSGSRHRDRSGTIPIEVRSARAGRRRLRCAFEKVRSPPSPLPGRGVGGPARAVRRSPLLPPWDFQKKLRSRRFPLPLESPPARSIAASHHRRTGSRRQNGTSADRGGAAAESEARRAPPALLPNRPTPGSTAPARSIAEDRARTDRSEAASRSDRPTPSTRADRSIDDRFRAGARAAPEHGSPNRYERELRQSGTRSTRARSDKARDLSAPGFGPDRRPDRSDRLLRRIPARRLRAIRASRQRAALRPSPSRQTRFASEAAVARRLAGSRPLASTAPRRGEDRRGPGNRWPTARRRTFPEDRSSPRKPIPLFLLLEAASFSRPQRPLFRRARRGH